MTNRDEQLELLTAYLDDEATPAERAEVEALLERDPDARRLLDELRRVSTLVAGLPRASAPGGFSESVVARLERDALLGSGDGPKRRWTLGNWSALAASIALVVAAGWFILPQVNRLQNESVVRSPTADSDEAVALSDKPEELDAAFRRSARGERSARPVESRGSAGRRYVVPSTMERTLQPPTAIERPRETALAAEAPRLATMGQPVGFVANCVTVKEAAEVDQSLNEGKLTPDALASAKEDAFTNRLEVVVPTDSDVGVVQRAVEGNLAKYAVANLDHAPKDKPINRLQCFYANQDESHTADKGEPILPMRPESESQQRAPSAGDQVGRQFVVNIPREQTKDLIADVQTACAANGINTNFDVNGMVYEMGVDPTVVADSLVSVIDDAGSLYFGAMGDTFNYDDDPGDMGIRRTQDADGDGTADAQGARAIGGEGKTTGQPGAAKPEAAKKANDDGYRRHRRRAVTNDREEAEAEKDKSMRGRSARAARKSKLRATPGAKTRDEDEAGRPDEHRAGESRGGGKARDDKLAAAVPPDFVGPLAPEPPAPQDLVTCVVTIRPVTTSDTTTRDTETAGRRAEPTGRARRGANTSAPTSKPTTSRPAGGASRG